MSKSISEERRECDEVNRLLYSAGITVILNPEILARLKKGGKKIFLHALQLSPTSPGALNYAIRRLEKAGMRVPRQRGEQLDLPY